MYKYACEHIHTYLHTYVPMYVYMCMYIPNVYIHMYIRKPYSGGENGRDILSRLAYRMFHLPRLLVWEYIPTYIYVCTYICMYISGRSSDAVYLDLGTLSLLPASRASWCQNSTLHLRLVSASFFCLMDGLVVRTPDMGGQWTWLPTSLASLQQADLFDSCQQWFSKTIEDRCEWSLAPLPPPRVRTRTFGGRLHDQRGWRWKALNSRSRRA